MTVISGRRVGVGGRGGAVPISLMVSVDVKHVYLLEGGGGREGEGERERATTKRQCTKITLEKA